MRRIIEIGSALLAILATASGGMAQRPDGPLRGLDEYVTRAMREWRIAGLAVAVVKNDSVVYARGFGTREVGKPEPVDTNTIFAIGSNTKLFTAVASGMLVDDGQLAWDEPATRYLPGFQLYDPWVTREVTLRDLLSHRTGLGDQAGNMIAFGSANDRREVLRRTRFMKPSSSFRSRFAYQNLMVLAAGEVAASAAGVSWDELVTTRILRPLGMRSTSTSVSELSRAGNVATPHTATSTSIRPMPWRNIDNIGPAGSINSSVADMARWLRFLLRDGRVNGRPLIRPGTLREIEAPQTIIGCGDDTLRKSTHFCAYGLGVLMSDYQGVKVLSHTGGIDGMLSDLMFVPERGLGIVVLTNTDGHNLLFTALARQILDMELGVSPRDWSATLLSEQRKMESAIASMEATAEQRRPKNASATLPLARLVGRYTSETYGDMRISADGDQLTLRFGPVLTGRLDHWARDTYRLTWFDAGSAFEAPTFVSFVADPFGVVTSLRVRDDLMRPPGMHVWDNDEFNRLGETAVTSNANGGR
jgi:CubicO group peptidase (beta-lactamase class C family)